MSQLVNPIHLDSQAFQAWLKQDMNNFDMLLQSDKFLDTPFQDLAVEDELTELKDNAFFGSKAYLGYSAKKKM